MEQFDEKKLKLFIADKFKVSSHKTPFYIYWIRMFCLQGLILKSNFLSQIKNGIFPDRIIFYSAF